MVPNWVIFARFSKFSCWLKSALPQKRLRRDRARSVAFGGTPVIQTLKLERIMRYEVDDHEWAIIKSMLRVNDSTP